MSVSLVLLEIGITVPFEQRLASDAATSPASQYITD